jgi:hypothetical protein
VVFIDVGGEDVLESSEPLIPIEGFGIPKLGRGTWRIFHPNTLASHIGSFDISLIQIITAVFNPDFGIHQIPSLNALLLPEKFDCLYFLILKTRMGEFLTFQKSESEDFGDALLLL